MNRTFFLRKEDVAPQWREINAEGMVLGRLASEIAQILRGKDKPEFTPHVECGDYVIVLNADKVILSGDKWDIKEYIRHTGFHGGKRITMATELLVKHPTQLVELAVKRMLPKNKMADKLMKKLKIYTGIEHPHTAQAPKRVEFKIRTPSQYKMPKFPKNISR